MNFKKISSIDSYKIIVWWLIVTTCSLVLLLILQGKVKEGKVIKKEYQPREVNLEPHYITDEKWNLTTMRYPEVDDEDYIITIEWKNKQWKIRTRKLYVKKSLYNCLQEWDHFVVGEDCSDKDDNHQTQK